MTKEEQENFGKQVMGRKIVWIWCDGSYGYEGTVVDIQGERITLITKEGVEFQLLMINGFRKSKGRGWWKLVETPTTAFILED